MSKIFSLDSSDKILLFISIIKKLSTYTSAIVYYFTLQM